MSNDVITEEPAATDLLEAAAGRKLPEQPTRVLIADDEHLVAAGLKSSLSDLGYVVLGPAADGDAAIEMCRDLRPDMALLDLRMPKTDGLAASEIIYKQMAIPVVILSAYSDPGYVQVANRAGVFGYLLKPVTQDQLRVGISVAWGRYLDAVGQYGEIRSLKERLEARKIIEQAKWIIVRRKSTTEPEAMKLLQRQARNNRRTLADVARSILENENLFADE
ncbi:MAG: response regulator [Phycisphaerales bacterium]|nr:response regulator [Phycisphaerales bacterium]